ncbi:MAG: hypothetical protein J5828_02465 [Desulfovibrionaceae bacterium]|nr:hypothetical protein [Desulfovibrionaceae bacterium]
MSSFFDFDTPGKKFVGLVCAFALWLFCSTNVGLLPWLFGSRRPWFSFTLEIFARAPREYFYDWINTLFTLAYLYLAGFILIRFLKAQKDRAKAYFFLVLLMASLFSLPHPWIVDLICAALPR